jgi:hypothetical protein
MASLGEGRDMQIGRLAERAMGMDEAAWARHANPWSGWSRVTLLPLLAAAIWSRAWLGWGAAGLVALVVLWAWANPRAFPPPGRTDAWMTRGVLGERLWLARRERPIPRHHARMALLLSAVSAAGLLPLSLGLWRYDAGLTLFGLALSMGAKLWFLDRMVWLHDTRPDAPPASEP